MRGSLGCFLVVSMVGTFAATLQAQAGEAIQVERAVGAEDCPDAASLAERVAAIRGRADLPGGGSYVVEFTRTAELYRATIGGGAHDDSQRVLEGRGPNCAALAQATAVTLALLFDSRAGAPPEANSAEPAPAAHKPRLAERRVVEAAPAATPVAGTLAIGISGLLGVLRPVAPGLSGELGLQVAGFRAGLGLLWAPTQSLELGPGRIDTSLYAGTARSCLVLKRVHGLSVSLCAGLFIGVVDARSAGFTRNARRIRPWLSVPLELTLAELSGPVGWELSVGALGSLVHDDFEVHGLGAPYHEPRVGGSFTLRGIGMLPWY